MYCIVLRYFMNLRQALFSSCRISVYETAKVTTRNVRLIKELFLTKEKILSIGLKVSSELQLGKTARKKVCKMRNREMLKFITN